MKNFMHRGLRPEVSFWRDSVGHEVDLLIGIGGDEAVPVEIKSGQTFSSDFVDNLAWWRKTSGQLERTGVVVYGGDRSFTYKADRVLSWKGWGLNQPILSSMATKFRLRLCSARKDWR